jgi:hypothetical protein
MGNDHFRAPIRVYVGGRQRTGRRKNTLNRKAVDALVCVVARTLPHRIVTESWRTSPIRQGSRRIGGHCDKFHTPIAVKVSLREASARIYPVRFEGPRHRKLVISSRFVDKQVPIPIPNQQSPAAVAVKVPSKGLGKIKNIALCGVRANLSWIL